MQTCPGGTDQVSQPAFNVHVQVFEGRIPGEIAPLDFFLHRGKAVDYRVGVVLGNDALLGKHRRVGLGAGDVLPVEPAVVVYGDGVFAVVLH